MLKQDSNEGKCASILLNEMSHFTQLELNVMYLAEPSPRLAPFQPQCLIRYYYHIAAELNAKGLP